MSLMRSWRQSYRRHLDPVLDPSLVQSCHTAPNSQQHYRTRRLAGGAQSSSLCLLCGALVRGTRLLGPARSSENKPVFCTSALVPVHALCLSFVD